MQIDINKPVLDLNDKIAKQNQKLLQDNNVYMLDVLGSPGSGKTSTILATIDAMRANYKFAVIEGDIASKVDAKKIEDAGIDCIQINTGGECHLESQAIHNALKQLDLSSIDVVLVENVGNLVCPAEFYLGENDKVCVLSVPEGHDKPLKYPVIFRAVSAVVLSKVDTMPVFDFDEVQFRNALLDINPQVPIFSTSATKGTGIKAWTTWLESRIESVRR